MIQPEQIEEFEQAKLRALQEGRAERIYEIRQLWLKQKLCSCCDSVKDGCIINCEHVNMFVNALELHNKRFIDALANKLIWERKEME